VLMSENQRCPPCLSRHTNLGKNDLQQHSLRADQLGKTFIETKYHDIQNQRHGREIQRAHRRCP
jgi:hypothetical protein